MRCPTPSSLVDVQREKFPQCFVHLHEIQKIMRPVYYSKKKAKLESCWWWILLRLWLLSFDDACFREVQHDDALTLNIFHVTLISCWGVIFPHSWFKAFQVFFRLYISSVILHCMASMVLISSCSVDSRLELCTLNWCWLMCDIYSVGNCYPRVLFLKLNYEVIPCCWLNLSVFVSARRLAMLIDLINRLGLCNRMIDYGN